MPEHPKDLDGSVTQGSASSEDKKDLYEKYQRIQVYEYHFNNLQTEIRKLASVWLLVALGAIAYLIRGEYLAENNVSKLMIDAKLLISIHLGWGRLTLPLHLALRPARQGKGSSLALQ